MIFVIVVGIDIDKVGNLIVRVWLIFSLIVCCFLILNVNCNCCGLYSVSNGVLGVVVLLGFVKCLIIIFEIGVLICVKFSVICVCVCCCLVIVRFVVKLLNFVFVLLYLLIDIKFCLYKLLICFSCFFVWVSDVLIVFICVLFWVSLVLKLFCCKVISILFCVIVLLVCIFKCLICVIICDEICVFCLVIIVFGIILLCVIFVSVIVINWLV